MRKASYILLLLLLFSSCKKDEDTTPIDWGYDYYPVAVDYWLEYEVDSIFYDDFTIPTTIDTSIYQMREEFPSVFQDLTGEDNFRVEQFKREEESLPWSLYQVASVKKNSSMMQRMENDLRFVRLAFPLINQKSWDGHVYIDVQDEPTLEYLDDEQYNWDYHYSDINVPKQIGDFYFDSCIVVSHIDEENLFEKKYSQEIYAKDVGLVYKEIIVLNTQAAPDGRPFLERAESGFIIKQTIKDFPQ